MTTFDNREQAFEKKFVHEEELRFRARSRRNRLMGLWVAELLGKTGPEADAYAKEVVLSDFNQQGDDCVLRKIHTDLDAAGIVISPEQLRVKIDTVKQVARQQIMAE